jgi:outer membrane protein assembly factor BamD (BamD/ComL family)
MEGCIFVKTIVMRIRRTLLVFQFVCGFPIVVAAQQSSPVYSYVRSFENGKELFQQKNYSSARQVLKTFVQQKESADLIQEAEYMIVCTSYELNETDRIAQLRNYLNRYPDSHYANRINSLIASAEQMFSIPGGPMNNSSVGKALSHFRMNEHTSKLVRIAELQQLSESRKQIEIQAGFFLFS